MKEVFKFQRPLMCPKDMANTIMVYNQDRTINFMADYEPDFIDEIFADEVKVFYEAEIDDDGNLVLGDKVEGWETESIGVEFYETVKK